MDEKNFLNVFNKVPNDQEMSPDGWGEMVRFSIILNFHLVLSTG